MLKQYIQSFRAHYYMNNPKRFKSAVRAEHTHAYQIMKKQFPSAFTCPQVVRSVVDVLEPHGYRVSDQKTRLVMSTCPDEINKNISTYPLLIGINKKNTKKGNFGFNNWKNNKIGAK